MRSGAWNRLASGLAAVGCVLAVGACAGVQSPAPGGAGPATPSGTAPAASAPAPSGPATATAPAGAAGAAVACTDSQVAISLTHTGAIGGQAGGYLTFTNRGTATCELTGWPTVVGLNGVGKSAELSHATSTMFGAWQYVAPMPVVRLAPGGSAYAVVAGDDHPVGNATSCPAPYTRLKITIPGGSAASTVSAWLPGAGTFLPTCTTIGGAVAAEISDVVPLSSLAH